MDKRIGAQLYTIRDYCETVEDFRKAMETVKNIGYKHVQISGVKVEDAKAIKEICDENGLQITCTHRPLNNFINDFEGELERHKIYGCKYAGVGSIPRELTYDEEGFFKILDSLNEIADKFKENGITFTYHNHAWEYEKFAGKNYMAYILERGRFSLMVDVYWLSYAGINPAKFIRDNADRIECIHFKDLGIINSEEIIMTEVGQGNLDWDEIIKACEESGVKYALVEQDVCRTEPMSCLETSYKFLTTKGFN